MRIFSVNLDPIEHLFWLATHLEIEVTHMKSGPCQNYGYADHPSTPPLTFDQPFMDDGECVIKYGKNNIKKSNFYFSGYCEKFIENGRFKKNEK